MVFADTHTHLFVEEFDADRESVLQRAIQSRVKTLLLPNIDETTIEALKSFAALDTTHCFPMMGLHPCSVKENYREVLADILKELDSGYQYYGVGEIGMDLYWDKTTLDWQSDAFLQQCSWAVERQLGVSIHTRSATYETIKLLKQMKQVPKGVFHCFSGSIEEAQEIIKLGFYIGIGGVVTFKNAGLPEVLKELSLDHIVLETDAPYLSPVPYRGKRNESSYIPLVAEKLAEIFNVPVSRVAEVTSNNSKKVFGV